MLKQAAPQLLVQIGTVAVQALSKRKAADVVEELVGFVDREIVDPHQRLAVSVAWQTKRVVGVVEQENDTAPSAIAVEILHDRCDAVHHRLSLLAAAHFDDERRHPVTFRRILAPMTLGHTPKQRLERVRGAFWKLADKISAQRAEDRLDNRLGLAQVDV
jgi:hypothetical protein